jgi:hypothetical protein
METIKIYLENMFRNLPGTKEIERLKNELLYNMEERYNELKGEGKKENEAVGIVISEFGNIDELLEEMNIETNNKKDNYPEISFEEAEKFISLKEESTRLIAIGVSIIILGVSLLVLLVTLAENRYIFQNFSSDVQDLIPVIALFLFIVPAVGIFIYSGTKLEKYKFIDEGLFELSSATKSALKTELNDITPRQTMKIIIGVGLIILSPVAVLIGALFGDSATSYGVCVLLVIVAAALLILIPGGSISEPYKKLLKTDEFDPKIKKQNKVIGAVAGVVWPIAVCIFLYTGLALNLWNINWIVFPITGILFGGFSALYNAIKSN